MGDISRSVQLGFLSFDGAAARGLVEQDPLTDRWNVFWNDIATAAFARDKSIAVGQAFHAASLEQAGTAIDVTVWSVLRQTPKKWPT